MKEDFYYKLKELFAEIRLVFQESILDNSKLNALMNNLKTSRKHILKHAKKKERTLLLYCIDTLFEVIKENNKEKISNFADLAHNIPDIYLGKRNFYSFHEEIKLFREKYGEAYFKNMNNIYPYFSKKAPKNALQFFFPESDEAFKEQHPVGYWILVICGITAFLLPLIIFSIYISHFDQDQGVGGWPALAIVGCLIIGIGLFNIVAAFIHQYLGHKLTAICLLGGSALVALSIFMVNNPHLYNQNVSIYYFVSLFMMLLPALFYVYFRFSVGSWLKRSRRISNSKFENLTKGKKNFWWYVALHKEVNLGILYYINKAFTILYVSLFALTLLTGLIKEMSLILCPLNILLYLLTAFMVIFSRIQDNLDFHKKPFVIFARSRNKGIDSIIFDLFAVFFVLAMAYVNLMLATSIWGIELPHF
ncbi:MAG: hypothetical protein IJ398_05440 [Clostridia bacterium]|nr:hypothetical protein [Clostridia bacterium]